MKKFIIAIAILTATFTVNAQNFVDALRYTQLFPAGSARSVSMGGAFGSLGGDMASIYTNPAGLGVYRKSEFVFSPGFNYSKTKADYYGSSAEDFKYTFKLNNIGYIGTYNSDKKTGWVSASFGIAYNQLKDFNNTVIIDGDNTNSSLVDYFFQYANGVDPEQLDPFWERLAFDAYVIDTVPGSAFEYNTPVPAQVHQRRTIDTKGGIGEYALSFGTNFSHILYLGASFSILKVYYSEVFNHSEFDMNDLGFEYFTFNHDLTTRGTGYTFRLGMILRPIEALRIGSSISLPTLYKLEDGLNTSMSSAYENTVYPGYTLYTDYKVVTPFKATGSVGFQFGKIGLLSVDAEYINYASMRLRESSDGYDYYTENKDITDAFRKVVNIRSGGELRFNALAFRAGFAYFPSPYKKGELNEDADHYEISGGIGIRQNNFFIDLGTTYNIHDEYYNLYDDPGGSNLADLKQNKLSFVTTIGFRF